MIASGALGAVDGRFNNVELSSIDFFPRLLISPELLPNGLGDTLKPCNNPDPGLPFGDAGDVCCCERRSTVGLEVGVLIESVGIEIFGRMAAEAAGVGGAVALLEVVSLSATLLDSSPPKPGGTAGPASSCCAWACACASACDVSVVPDRKLEPAGTAGG